MKKTLLLLLANIFFANFLLATHSRAGEIIYTQIDDKTIEARVISYTDAISVSADRDSLDLCWGDGTCSRIARVNGPIGSSGVPNGEILENGYKKSIYKTTHVYAEFGNYFLSMTDPNRNEDIENIALSVNIPFFIETEVFLEETLNSSPFALQTPTDFAFVGQPFMHILNAVDLDGDSIAYKMIVPLQASGQPVTGYFDLTDIGPGTNNTLSFNEESGLLLWTSPQKAGGYNIAIEILSYRDGEINGRVIRDMLILVFEEENEPPLINSDSLSNNEPAVFVNVGDTIYFDMNVVDFNLDQEITLSSTSELYNASIPAIFDIGIIVGTLASPTFIWVVSAEQIRSQPYQVVFKVQDNLAAASYLEGRYIVKDFMDNTRAVFLTPDFKIFPNPADDYIMLQNIDSAIKYYSIWNNAGQKVQAGNINGNQRIDIQTLSSGIYYLQLEDRVGQAFVVD